MGAYNIVMKARDIPKLLLRALPFLIIAAILFSVIFFPRGEAAPPVRQRVVTVWNVDTFEGGKGSRTSFLRSVARRVEAEREGVYYLVTSFTAEGAEAALAEGRKPDLLSFGVGLSAFAEESLPLPYEFAGGKIGADCLAVPWCMGGYFLFSEDENFEAEGRTALSAGGSNLTALSARFAGVEGETAESSAAYTGFLSGKYRYLLGTQRDICRFQARGKDVFSRPLTGYNDLFQYISLLKTAEREDALAFVEELLSGSTSERLGEIGMFPVQTDGATRTVSVFADARSLADLASRAERGEDLENLEKFLKTV